MAAKGNTFSNDFLKLIYNGSAISLLADNTATTPLTVLYISLHSSSPGAAGNQQSNECTYTSYARQSVARTSGGFTVTTTSVSPAATVTFPAATGGSETVTHFGIGTALSGTGKLLYFGTVTPNLSIANGSQPTLTTASTVTES